MTQLSPDELYRKALEAEGGEPVSAGARVAHVIAALEQGRAVYVDLSAVPEAKRPVVVAEIRSVIDRATSPRSAPPSLPVPEMPGATG
jgi:hypothetical protein